IAVTAAACLWTTAQPFAQQPPSNSMPIEAQRALLTQYCQGCHNDTVKSGNMSLTSLDLAHVDQNAELAEKIIRKLGVGLMPPAGASRPDKQTIDAFRLTLEVQLDKAAAANPNPGSRPSQRLTRTEYANSIRDMFGVEIDVSKYIAADTVSDGF